MLYLTAASFLSPSQCADSVLAEIDKIIELQPAHRDELRRLIRQRSRDQFEQCAQLAECWVAENDIEERLDGIQVGDAIAEEIRRLADDRVSKRAD